MIGPLNRFQPRDTVAWFESAGWPSRRKPMAACFRRRTTGTIVECLTRAARAAGVKTNDEGSNSSCGCPEADLNCA